MRPGSGASTGPGAGQAGELQPGGRGAGGGPNWGAGRGGDGGRGDWGGRGRGSSNSQRGQQGGAGPWGSSGGRGYSSGLEFNLPPTKYASSFYVTFMWIGLDSCFVVIIQI